ncbi:DNA repair photolyase [Candidatus Tenderia electrophaga]|jgi:DNA repair photolyase|uniref:DNA repair photolyase n=1 Tax=Candidatus Tenderia electrophaga TaxID=1748243 RepID=A0A0S2TH51_9GAMM|nr:DNA repair photolyase [Candidatus Tenderia electrophaga]
MSKTLTEAAKGRGALGNPDNRFEHHSRESVDDGWDNLEQPPERIRTTLTVDSAKTVISYNRSPDVPFDRSINPYRGCEHGCVYCFARPTHAWLGLSPGLDFESRLFYKPDAAALLRTELNKKNYRCAPIALGINTDAYQPVERKLGLTRELLKVLLEYRHPVTLVTKSALVERDLDLLTELADHGLIQVALSITTLERSLSTRLEPRAAAPERRLQTVAKLSAAGIPTSVMVAPLIPVLTDHELEDILSAARQAGAGWAGYVLLRLPHEVKELFKGWLSEHAPLKAEHIMKRIRDCRGGQEYQAEFGTRMRGEGVFAELLKKRYRLAMKRLAFAGLPELNTTAFRQAADVKPQLSLF